MANSPFIYGPNGALDLIPGGITMPGSTSGTLQIQPAATTTTYGVTMPAAQGAASTALINNGSGVLSWSPAGGGAVPPTVTTLLSGTGSYSPPSGVTSIKVTFVGGGQGGTSESGVAAGAGGTTTFGTSLLTATGGSGSGGGTATITSPAIAILTVQGQSGGASDENSLGGIAVVGGAGGSTPLAGAGNTSVGAGQSAKANTGSGGAAGSQGVSTNGQTGGSAAGYGVAYINSPSTLAPFAYSVGTGSAGGVGGTNAGGSGGSGAIIIEEFYANGAIGTATTVTGSVQSSQIQGTTAGGNAPAGFLGEFISANSAGVSPVTTGVFVTLASISLTPGDWDVEGTTSLSPPTTGTAYTGAISLNATSTDSIANGGVNVVQGAITTTTGLQYISPTGKRRINVSTTTTVNLIGQVTFTVLGAAQWTSNSFIGARRVR